MNTLLALKKLLLPYQGEWFDNIFVVNIPENVVDSSKTMALLTEVLNTSSTYGSDTLYSLIRRVQIQIFYGDELSTAPEDVENDLLNLLEQNGWKLVSYSGHSIEPDTKQLFVTLQVQQTKMIEKG